MILTINTVAPRRLLYQDMIRRELEVPTSQRLEVDRLYPVISTLETPGDVVKRLRIAVPAPWDVNGRFPNEQNDPRRELKEERRAVTRIRAKCLDKTEQEVVNEEEVRMDKVRVDSEMENAHVDSEAPEKYNKLLKLGGTRSPEAEDPVAFYHTTLDKVDREMAVALVGRGYANTSLTLYLTGLTDKLVVPEWVAERVLNLRGIIGTTAPDYSQVGVWDFGRRYFFF